MKKTKHNITLDMVLEYAKVFDQEGKPGDIDRGNPKADQKWLRELAKNPEAKVNCYFTSEEQIEFLEGFDGFDRMVTNPQTGQQVDRIKDGNPDFGIGKYIQIKRKMNDIREFKNKQGQIEEMDKGGAPVVKILSVATNEETGETTEAFIDYGYDALGAPSNGTEAKVRFEPRYMRLDAIAVTNLIEYVEGDSEDDF
jgi:hypothetical protein